MSSGGELDTVIHKTPNGYFAISAGVLPHDGKDQTIQRLVSEGKIPADSFCTSVKNFELVEVPLADFWPSSPIFAFGLRVWPNPPMVLVLGTLLGALGFILLVTRSTQSLYRVEASQLGKGTLWT